MPESLVMSFHTSTDKMVQHAVRTFRDQYGNEPDYCVFAPGRVNLIGEHTDYNDGFVLPLALPHRTIIVGSPSSLPTARIYSCNITNPQESGASFKIDEYLAKGHPSWANYVKGVIFQYLKELPKNLAFDAVIISNVPVGSGLSSSASLEVAVATFLEKLCNITNVSKVEKALRCQQAEHTFADTPCGIMDQYISSMGKAGNLLLIDCRSHEYKLVELCPPNVNGDHPVLLVSNSMVKHSLGSSAYPERVAQCKEAVRIIAKKYPAVRALRDVTLEMLYEFKDEMAVVVFKRALHAVSEDRRTLAAVEAMGQHDYASVGELMTASHMSLRDNYEVSCKELDILVDLALKYQHGVYGSRMTGGGFGGCTVTLVKKNAVDGLKEYLERNYKLSTDHDCECYVAEPSDGTGEIDIISSNIDQKKQAWLSYVVPVSVGILAVGVIGYMMYAMTSPRGSSTMKPHMKPKP